MTVLPGLTNSSEAESSYVLNHDNDDEPEEPEKVVIRFFLSDIWQLLFQPVIQPGENNQIVINSGNAYQRVTVVPADNNSGELSYVLIVQDPDIKDDDQTDGEPDMAGW